MISGSKKLRHERYQEKTSLSLRSTESNIAGSMLLPLIGADALVEKDIINVVTFLSLPREVRLTVYENVFIEFYAMDLNQHVLGSERYSCEEQAKRAKCNIIRAAPPLKEEINDYFYSRSAFWIDLNCGSNNFITHPNFPGPNAAWRPDDELIKNLILRVHLPVPTGIACEYLKILIEGYDTAWNPASGYYTRQRIQPRLARLKKLRLRITSENRKLHRMDCQIVPPGLDKQVRPRVPKSYGATYSKLCEDLSYPDTARILGTEKELMKIFRSFLGRQDHIIIEIQYLAYAHYRTAFYPITPSWSAELYGDVVFDGVAADFWANVEDPAEWTSARCHNDASQNDESKQIFPEPPVNGYKARSILGVEVSAEWERLYFVHWIGSDGLEKLTWESESIMLETAPKLLERYKYAVLYNEPNVQLLQRGLGKRRAQSDGIKKYQLFNTHNNHEDR